MHMWRGTRTYLVHWRKCFTMTYVTKQSVAVQSWKPGQADARVPRLERRQALASAGRGAYAMAALSELVLPGYHEFDHVARQAMAACPLPYDGDAEPGEPGVRQAFERTAISAICKLNPG